MSTRYEKIQAVCRRRERGLAVVLEDIHDPHNAAAIMRTCDALGVQDVRLVFVTEKPYNPRRVGKSSSSSANKWLTFTTYRSTEECLAALRAQHFFSAATVMRGEDASLWGAELHAHERLALWVGNEHRGLSEQAIRGADMRVAIPMKGMVESLNVSVAAALCIAEVVRARADLHAAHTLSDDEAARLAQELSMR